MPFFDIFFCFLNNLHQFYPRKSKNINRSSSPLLTSPIQRNSQSQIFYKEIIVEIAEEIKIHLFISIHSLRKQKKTASFDKNFPAFSK